MALESTVATLDAKIDKSSNESIFADEHTKAYNRNNSALEIPFTEWGAAQDRAMQTFDG